MVVVWGNCVGLVFLVGMRVCFGLIMGSLGLWFDLDRFVNADLSFGFWRLLTDEFVWGWVCGLAGYGFVDLRWICDFSLRFVGLFGVLLCCWFVKVLMPLDGNSVVIFCWFLFLVCYLILIVWWFSFDLLFCVLFICGYLLVFLRIWLYVLLTAYFGL